MEVRSYKGSTKVIDDQELSTSYVYSSTIDVTEFDTIDVILDLTAAASITEVTWTWQWSISPSPGASDWVTLQDDDGSAFTDYERTQAVSGADKYAGPTVPTRGRTMRVAIKASTGTATDSAADVHIYPRVT